MTLVLRWDSSSSTMFTDKGNACFSMTYWMVVDEKRRSKRNTIKHRCTHPALYLLLHINTLFLPLNFNMTSYIFLLHTCQRMVLFLTLRDLVLSTSEYQATLFCSKFHTSTTLQPILCITLTTKEVPLK